MLSFFKTKVDPITTIFPQNFVDIHSHLLPGIDDGAKTIEDSIILIKKMNSYGIKNFICTPHIMESVWENNPTTINNSLEQVKKHLIETGLADINIKAAAEYMLDNNFSNLLKNEPLLTLKDNFILVEMSYLNAPYNLYEQLFEIQIAGYKPVLAHPERYAFFHNSHQEFKKLKEAGCLFQLNLLSLSNYYGNEVQQCALKLLKENRYDFVGSDTHHLRHLNYLKHINNKKTLQLVAPLLNNNLFFN
jgi:tyrosine-protein phosphatase YwqE